MFRRNVAVVFDGTAIAVAICIIDVAGGSLADAVRRVTVTGRRRFRTII